MATAGANIVLYAADAAEYAIGLATSEILGLARSQVSGDYATVWSKLARGSYIVIAIGGDALYALAYNPCGWSNPAGTAKGSTPFIATDAPLTTASSSHFVNAAGKTAAETLKLTVMLTYYALHGKYPGTLSTLPSQIPAQDTCLGNASQGCPCSSSTTSSAVAWGVDSCSAADVSINGYSTLYDYVVSTQGTPQFWGRYIGAACALSFSEVKFLHQKGVKILLVYNGATSSTVAGGTQSGVSDANHAITAAKGLGVPTGTYLFCDIEAPWQPSTSWLEGWTTTLRASGYGAGVYANTSGSTSSFNSAFCKTSSTVQKELVIWTSEPSVTCTTQTNAPSFKPDTTSCGGNIALWQYAIACGTNQVIDTDLAKQSALAYLW